MNPQRPFAALTPITLPSGLLERVLTFVDQEVVRRLRLQARLTSFLLISSLAYTSFFWSDWMTRLQTSAVADYARLAWSDPDIVLSSIGTFVSGILESLPVSALLLVLLNLTLAVGAIGFIQRMRTLQRLPFMLSKN